MVETKHVFPRAVVAACIYYYHSGIPIEELAEMYETSVDFIERWAYGERYKEIFHRYMVKVGEGKAPFRPRKRDIKQIEYIDGVYDRLIIAKENRWTTWQK